MRLRWYVAGVLALACLHGQASAQTLLGMRNPGDGGRQLTTINTSTGAVTTIGSSISPPLSTIASSAVDTANNRIFFDGTPSGETDPRIYTVSLADGSVVTNPTMTGAAASPIMGIEFDEAEGVIYAYRSLAGARQLVTISRTTGAVNALGAGTGASTSSSSGVCALDPTGNRFFIVGQFVGDTDSRLFVFNTTNGSVTNVVMAGTGTLPINGLEWDAGESVLYALRNPGGGARQLATINTATGAVTGLGTGTGVNTTSSSGVDALDPAGNRFFFIGTPSGDTDPRVYTFDTTNGNITASPTVVGGAAAPFATLNYEPTALPVGRASFSIE